MSEKNLKSFVLLFHHRWAVPVLAELRRTDGAKFVTLVTRLGISRDSLRHTLDALIEWGWVRRNPGHGHPLRPEYLLTRRGAELAPLCARVMKVLSALGIEDIALRKWSLPVVYSLNQGHGRFSDVRGNLPGLTPRALALTLKGLQQIGLVTRFVSAGYPPASHYKLTADGRELSLLLKGLAG